MMASCMFDYRVRQDRVFSRSQSPNVSPGHLMRGAVPKHKEVSMPRGAQNGRRLAPQKKVGGSRQVARSSVQVGHHSHRLGVKPPVAKFHAWDRSGLVFSLTLWLVTYALFVGGQTSGGKHLPWFNFNARPKLHPDQVVAGMPPMSFHMCDV